MGQVDYMKLYLANRATTEGQKIVDTQIDFALTQPPPGAYHQYEIESAKLEERIAEMRASPNPPKTLIEGLLFLGTPIKLA